MELKLTHDTNHLLSVQLKTFPQMCTVVRVQGISDAHPPILVLTCSPWPSTDYAISRLVCPRDLQLSRIQHSVLCVWFLRLMLQRPCVCLILFYWANTPVSDTAHHVYTRTK